MSDSKERLRRCRRAVGVFSVEIGSSPITCGGEVSVYDTLQRCREHVRADRDQLAAKDAEIAKLRAEVESAKTTLDNALDARDRWRELATKRMSDLTALTADLARLRAIEAAAVAYLAAQERIDSKWEEYGIARAALIKAVNP